MKEQPKKTTSSSQLNNILKSLGKMFGKKYDTRGRLLSHTNSGNFSELLPALPVTQGSPYDKKVIFSQKVSNLKKGEIILVICQFETTNNLGFNVMIASQVVLANSPDAIVGTEVTEASGFNVTKNMHHGKTVEVGTLIVAGNYPTKYINVIAYAASTAASNGDTLKLEKDYGRLSVLRFGSP